LLAFEYGWTVDYILSLPLEIIEYMIEAIMIRRKKEAEAMQRAYKTSQDKKEITYQIGTPEAEMLLMGMGKLKIRKNK